MLLIGWVYKVLVFTTLSDAKAFFKSLVTHYLTVLDMSN